MKVIYSIAFAAFIMSSCLDKAKDEKAKVDTLSVVKNEGLQINPIPLDTLTKQEIDSIRIYYFAPYLGVMMATLSCEDVDPVKSRGVFDTTLYNRDILDLINREIGLLVRKEQAEIEEGPFLDARFTSTIYYENGDRVQLCLSTILAYTIYKDGIPQRENHRLIYYLKKYSGYYNKMPVAVLEQMPELIDSTFEK